MFNFVGEIGCNHLGSMDLAKEHIDVFSSFSKVKYLKFQKRTIRALLSEEEYNKPHPNPAVAYGSTYGLHREALEFSMSQHRELYEYCKVKGVIYSCSAWDVQAAKDLIQYIPEMNFIKIPSAANLNFEMMDYIIKNSNYDLHISLGMTTYEEIVKIIDFINNKKYQEKTVLYACTSGYPIKFEEVALREITRLKEMTKDEYLGIGMSGHYLGIALDIAAATLGANWIERHIVTCRSTIKHTDAPASLEPDGVRKLLRDLDALDKALKYKNNINEILPVEEEQRKKLKRNA